MQVDQHTVGHHSAQRRHHAHRNSSDGFIGQVHGVGLARDLARMVLPLVRHFPAQGQVFGLCRIRFPARHRLLCLGAQVLWYRNDPCHVRCPVLVDVTGIAVWSLGRRRRLLRRGSHCKEHYQSEKCLHPTLHSKTSSRKEIRLSNSNSRHPRTDCICCHRNFPSVTKFSQIESCFWHIQPSCFPES